MNETCKVAHGTEVMVEWDEKIDSSLAMPTNLHE